MRRIAAAFFGIVLAVAIMGCVAEVRTPAPPPPRVEVRPAVPYPDAVWVEGHWEFRGGSWVWLPGCWSARPHARAVWVQGHWRETPNGWRWVPGHWR